MLNALLTALTHQAIGTLLATNHELVVHTDPKTPAVFITTILHKEDTRLHRLQRRLGDVRESWYADNRGLERNCFRLGGMKVHAPDVLVVDDMKHHAFLEDHVVLGGRSVSENRHAKPCLHDS